MCHFLSFIVLSDLGFVADLFGDCCQVFPKKRVFGKDSATSPQERCKRHDKSEGFLLSLASRVFCHHRERSEAISMEKRSHHRFVVVPPPRKDDQPKIHH